MSSQSTLPDRLIRTKINPPRLSKQMIRRQHLIERLREGSSRQVTVFSASAGYGKSTLAYQWLNENGVPFAWVSLDEHDNRLDRFLNYLTAALRTIHPELGRETEDSLKHPQLPKPEQLADSLLHDLQELPQRLFLLLDDYHVIRNKDIHSVMRRLIQHQPADLHLVLLSRVDPPLALTQQRGRGQLNEIRSHDLRFTPNEVAMLLQQFLEEPVDDATVKLLADSTEGWPAGLRMAAMTMRETDDYKVFVRRYSAAGQKLAMDYLLGEVLDNLPNEKRLLLLHTAVLDRFCAPLLDTLTEGSVPGITRTHLLEELWSKNFFMIALDEQGIWYRFHHLFHQLLQQQLFQVFSKEAIAAVHMKASIWFERAGFVEEAIIHALEAGDVNRAAKLVEQHVNAALDEENWGLLERWLSFLPDEARRRPGLLATQAILEHTRYNIDAIQPLLDAAEEGLRSKEFNYTAAEETSWMGVINGFRAMRLTSSMTPQEALQYAQTALQQIDPKALYARSIAELWYVYALLQSGDTEQAVRVVRSKLAAVSGPPDTRTFRLMLAQAAIYYFEGNVFVLRSVTQTYLEMALRSNLPISLGWANFLTGWTFYQADELEEAAAHFAAAIEARYSIHVRAVVDSMTGLALVHKARGEIEDAHATVRMLRRFLKEQGPIAMLPVADSLAVRLGMPDVTGDYVRSRVVRVEQQLAADPWELPVLTACRLHITSGEPEQLALAGNLLGRCRAFAASVNNKRQLMQIDALLALQHEADGDHQAALALLCQAVLLGKPGGALHYFVDLGPELVPLLRDLRDQGTAPAYIERILGAYGEAEQAERSLAMDGQGKKPGALSPEAVLILGDLTAREMEILHLLGKRLTNKEIAAKLHIVPATVTKHTVKIYKKLEVDGRRQAVARALELGILPSN